MKSILALALLVGVALSNSTDYLGWKPEKEFVYRFESELLTGVPKIKNQFAGLKLSSDVLIQSYSDFSLRIKFVEPRFVEVNDELLVREESDDVLVPQPRKELPEQLRKHLESPFVVHLKRGLVESLYVDRDEPVVITNIKKALLSQLQLDLTASRRKEIDPLNVNSVLKPTDLDEIEKDQQTSFFRTEESSLVGDCETTYTLHPLPEYQAQELEHQWRVQKEQDEQQQQGQQPQRRGDSDDDEDDESEAAKSCKGKQYYQITKTKNFDNCRVRPVFNSWTGVGRILCDVSKSTCKDVMTHYQSSRYIVCGTPDEFVIRKIETDNSIISNPLSWDSEEKFMTQASVTLSLIKVKSGNFSPLPKPHDAKEKKSLIFEFPKQHQWSSEPKNEEEIVSDDESQNNDYDIKPILPMPDLKQSSSILPSVLSKDEIKQQVTQIMKKVVEEFFSSPESCPTKLDVAGQISTMSKYLRPLNYDELKEVTREVFRSLSSQNSEEQKIGQEILSDILSMIGTNPSVLIVKELIKEGKIQSSQAIHVLQNTIRNVRTPTKELLKELFELVKSVKSKESRQLYTVGLLHLSNLVYKACVNPTTSETHYPVHLYGRFCDQDSSFITQEYIPYLAQQLEHTEKESERMLYISALGKVGHKKILFPLVKAIEGKITQKPMARSLAVFSLKRLAKLEPATVRPLLLALIDNPAEKTEVRIAAVSVLPWTQPSTAELQKIAVRSWFEPSKQVASFIFSTLEELPKTEIPELKQVGLKAQGLKDLVKPFEYGVQFSHNAQTNVFVQYLKTAMNWRHSYTITEESPIPARIQNSIRLYGGSWQGKGLTFTVYTQGMDQLVDKVLAYLDLDTEVSTKVDEELKRLTEKLQIQKESDKASESLVQFRMFGLERFYAVDSEMYREILEKVTEEIRSGSELFTSGKNFLKTMNFYGFNGEIMAPTASGFPVYVVRKMPFSIGVKGSVRAEGSIYKLEGAIKAKLTPIVNIKMQTYMGAVSPFTKQLLVAGIEQSLHSSTPFEVKAEINRKGQLTTSIKTPEDVRQEIELLHVYTKPYTVVKSLNKIEPITKSSSLKEIVSGKQIQEYSSQIGQSVGMDAHVKIQGDLQIGDLSQMWEKLQQHNVLSLASLGYMTPSFRSYSAKLSFNPSSSMTKELKTRISIASAIRNSEDAESIESWYPYGGEANDVKEIEHMCTESFDGEEDVRACQQQQLQEVEQLTEQAETICHQLEDDDDQNDQDDESEQEEQQEKTKCLKSVKVCEQAKKLCKESQHVQKQIERQMQQEDQSFSPKKHMHKLLQEHDEQCQQKKEECESRVITLHKMRKMLNRQKHIHATHAINVEAGFGDDYSSKAIQTVIAIGGSRQENKYKYHAELLLKSPTQSLFEVEVEAQAELPEIRNRWNTKALLEEEIKMKSELQVRFGSRGEKKQVVVKADLIKSEQQKKTVQRSAEFEKCMEQERQGRPLAAVCTEVRHQAASVDKVIVSVRMPESLRKSVAVSKISSLIKAALLPQLIEEINSQSMDDEESFPTSRSEEQIFFEARFNRTGEVMQLKVQHESDKYLAKDIRVPQSLQEIFPFSLRNGVKDRVHQLLTNDQEPASCRVDSHVVSTFDNKTFDYKLNGCQHLLFADRSLVTPVAVLASGSKSSSEGKDVKIIAPKRIVELKSDKRSSVLIDGREEELSTGRTLIKKDSHGQPELELYRHHDGVIIVRIVSEDVKVLYDGRRVEVVAPRRIYSRACGICGDLNGDNTADLKTPEMCMLSEPRFVAYSYMLKDGEHRCEGVPSEDRQDYEQQRRECVKQRAIETPLRKLAEQSAQPKPLSRAHIVKEQLNQICISKEQVKVCGSGSNRKSGDSKPLKVKAVYVRFTCMPKPSRVAEQMVNRAQAGELIDELLAMPTRFSTKEMEPVVCSDDLHASRHQQEEDQDDDQTEDFNGSRAQNYRNLRRKYNGNDSDDDQEDDEERRGGRRTTTEEPWMNYPNSHRRY